MRSYATNVANSTLPAITGPAFRTVTDFVDAYKRTDKAVAEMTAEFVPKAAEAKNVQDQILPHLAYMQSLLSKKGSNHDLVIQARNNVEQIPWWTEYYRQHQDRLWESLRTMQRRIDQYKRDPSLPQRNPPTPTPHLNRAARRALLDGNHRAVELVKALEAGRDARSEITAFNRVMDAKRLDDIFTAMEFEEPALKMPELTNAADQLKVALAAEPDRNVASQLLTNYLKTVASEFSNQRIQITHVSATVEFSGRNHRIMPGDFLEKRDENATPTLCKCTGIGNCEQRRKVQEWGGGKWQKELVVYHESEADFRVITDDAARRLAPEAFPTTAAAPTPAKPREGL